MINRIAAIALLLATLAIQSIRAAPPAAADAKALPAGNRQECLKCLADLDHADYVVRRQAAARLHDMAADPVTAAIVAGEIADRWQSPDLSAEARAAFKPLVSVLRPQSTDASTERSDFAASSLIEQLTSGDFAARAAAERQLKSALRSSTCMAPLRAELRIRLADPELPPADRTTLIDAWNSVRNAWLLHDGPTNGELPTAEQISDWIERLAARLPAVGDAAAWTARECAARELLDALANDSWADELKSLLGRQLADARLNADARQRFESLLEWTRPMLVAEYWEGGRNLSLQYLYVDVPTTPEQGLRPTHFDWVNDRTAHCVSGNSLSPGNYPVGTLFPHPRQSGAQFCLVNLSTPQRRMRYAQEIRLPDAERLSAVSRRTLDRILAENRPLANDELLVLDNLDAAAVSRFVGPYFQRVADEHFLTAEQAEVGSHPRYGNFGRLSRHNAVCLILIERGTREAVSGILQAVDAEQIERPSPRARFFLPYIAVFTIARRDPSPEIDEILAGLINRTDALIADQANSSQIGATAAAILLRRHGGTPESFGLASANAELTADFEWVGYRYRSADQPGRVLDWWRAKSATSSIAQ